jgi:hypothetical protein
MPHHRRMTRKGRPIALKGFYGDLARALGGVDRMSEETGASTRTIRDWANGKTRPDGPARKILRQLLVEHGLDPDPPELNTQA